MNAVKKISKPVVSSISSKALLVSLSLSVWTARKHDRKVSQEVAANHNSDAKMGRYWKSLLPTDAPSYELCKQLRSECRDWHYKNTLPWVQDGAQILPSANYFSYTEKMREYKAQIEAADDKFFKDYPTLRKNAEKLLGNLYNDLDYPDVQAIRFKCKVSTNFMPMPDAQDFRVTLGDDEVNQIRADIEQQVSAATAQAMHDLWTRLYDAVSKMSARLSDPEAIFRNSLVDNMRELCQLLPRLNVTEDDDLNKLAREVEKKLTKLDADDLRGDDNLSARQSIAKQASEIERKMAAFMGGVK